jgi:hypothetical protein
MRWKEIINETESETIIYGRTITQWEDFYYYLQNSVADLRKGSLFWKQYKLTFDRRTTKEFQDNFVKTANWLYHNAGKEFTNTEIGLNIMRFVGHFVRGYPEYENFMNDIKKMINDNPILYKVGDTVEYEYYISSRVVDKHGETWNSYHTEKRGIWPFKNDHIVKTTNYKSPTYKTDNKRIVSHGIILKIERDDSSYKVYYVVKKPDSYVNDKISQKSVIKKIG